LEIPTFAAFAALAAAGLKLLGDTLEVYAKSDDVEGRPKSKKALTNAKAILNWIAAGVAVLAAAVVVFGQEAIQNAAWSVLVGLFVLTVVVRICVHREAKA
jgi:hypothetical protein